jgi:Protein of unknown function (DUF4038)/Domain of unknown function (DUF5060)
MKSALRLLALGGLASVFLSACGAGSGVNSNGGGNTNAGGAQTGGFPSLGSGGAQAMAGSSAGGAGGVNIGGTGVGGGSTGGSTAGASTGGGSSSAGTGGANGAGAGGGGPTPGGVEQWHPLDIVLGGSSASQLTDTLTATFSGPSGQVLKIPGFFDAPAGWTVRFAPPAVGTWSYITASSVAAVNGKTGTVQCVANTNPLIHGKVIVDTAHPHYFKYEDGTPYLLMGFEADWLALMDFGDASVPKATSLIDMYASRGFNQVLMNVFAYDTSWNSGKTSADDFGPPASYPWKGSNSAPDQTQMNPSFFLNFDHVVQYLFDHAVVAHIFFKVYNKGVKWPANGSREDDLYFNYVLARYQAYPNIVWDFAKESNNEPDVAYKSGRIKLIHDQDAYGHPVSTHTDEAYYASAASNGLLDFRTDQNTQSNFYGTVISQRNADAWPVINAEFDYEIGNDGGKTYSHASDKLVVFGKACEVAMAGGHLGYYYTYHAWDVVRSAEVPGGLGYYKNLYGVLSTTKWSELAPSDNLIDNAGVGRHCLAKAGAEYVVYLAAGGAAALDIKQIPAGTTLTGKWVNLISGQEQAIAALGNGNASLANPWSDPALAHLAQ